MVVRKSLQSVLFAHFGLRFIGLTLRPRNKEGLELEENVLSHGDKAARPKLRRTYALRFSSRVIFIAAVGIGAGDHSLRVILFLEREFFSASTSVG